MGTELKQLAATVLQAGQLKIEDFINRTLIYMIKPIKTERDYNKALKEIEKLWDAKPDTAKGDRLEVLVTLVEAYEQKHHRIDPPDPIEAIKFRMEQLELKPSDLADILGGRNRVSEILNKKMKLTVEMMRSLRKRLAIPAESLLA
jgi:HTH-type transcriptional regulator / antitoxin HigA